MAEAGFVEKKIVTVSKKSCEGVGVVGAVDRGCTLTKVLYSSEADADNYNLHFALFKNSEFVAGLEHLRQRGMVVQRPGAKLHVTGVGCDKYRDVIREKLGLEIEFVNEIVTPGRGIHWFVANVDESQLFYPDPQNLDLSEVRLLRASKYVKNISNVELDSSQTEMWPCLVLYMGSGAGIFRVEASGQASMVGSLWLAGTAFLGLAKALLNTDDYEEILSLAANGRRGGIDMEVRDMLANNAESPYGQFPDDMAIFSFGKLVASGRKLSDFKREDVAASLVHCFANNTMRTLALAAKASGITRLLLGGNFFRHELLRRELILLNMIVTGEQLRLQFVATGHTAAIGAMVSGADEDDKYIRLAPADAE